MKKRLFPLVFSLFALIMVWGCKDPLPLDTFDYEDLLVVEATITNDTKQQEIKLTRTTTLDTTDIRLENNAEVYVLASGSRYDFKQAENGTYLSDQNFAAKANDEYQLFINTAGGGSYSSSTVKPPQPATITRLYTERSINQNDVEGIQVLADVEGSLGNPFFRFEYEETYKIRTPYPSPYDFEITNYDVDSTGSISYDVETRANSRQETICYSTDKSTGINLGSATALDQDKLARKPILFIPADSPKIQQRYSVLAKVFSQSQASYTFYKNLKELGSNDDPLSQKQPGFITGNIISLDNSNEKVLGFFDVSLKAEKRIFFNYEDFSFAKPSFFYECFVKNLDYDDNTTRDRDPNEREEIYEDLMFGGYTIFKRKFGPNINTFELISGICSDCTTFSSNKKPEFWED